MAHVFISYSKLDITFARKLRGTLQSAGIPVWMDETALVPSERWWRQIEANIKSCSAFIIIMSPNSQSSDWVEREILLAEKLKKPIFPILLAGESWSRLANIQFADFANGNESQADELIGGLKVYVGEGSDAALTPVPPPLVDAKGRPTDRNRRLAIAGGLGIVGALLVLFLLQSVIFPYFLGPSFPTRTPTPSITPTLSVTATPTTPPLLPNLTVGRLRISPRNPAPGEIFILSITLSNTGEGESGPFNWVWDASQSEPPMLNTLDGRVDSIPPNGTRNISFPVSYGWWGTYISQLRVDVDSEVVETDDRDNQRPFTIQLGDAADPLNSPPFEVDFSLMPPDVVVEPPVTLTRDSYWDWNLKLSLVPIEGIDCSRAQMVLVDNAGDVLLQIDTSQSNADCVRSGIRVDILRDSVGAASVEVLPVANGIGSILYYDSPAATAPFFSVEDVPLVAGEAITFGDTSDRSRPIRSFVVFVEGGAIRITRLEMLRPVS